MNGGVFLRTREDFALRESVQVRLEFVWMKKALQLPGEVVHIVPPEMAGMGGMPGVALQFTDSAGAVRQKMRDLGLPVGDSHQTAADKGVRSAPRTPVRVAARIAGTNETVDGQTRNLSRSGVLVAVRGGTIPVGEAVRFTLSNPKTGVEHSVDGRVVRQVASGGEVSAVAVQFSPRADEKDEFERFVGELQGVEHTRRLGGISGPIAELGPQNVVQMFANSAQEGTLWLRHGEEEGMVCFQRGLLRLAKVGNQTGVKALVHMFAWRDGSFEFHARLEDVEMKGAPLPLEAALLDAARQMDEGARFPLGAHVTLVADADLEGYDSPSKVEAAILDLARAGFTVQRMLDVIPEPDPEIFRALQNLRDAGLVDLST
ncbi:MAG TPA: PilZ domain-containing protein [Myxococcota bacterium]|nr:PilZ domain-containing protein [Myxococcota bacterium]